jgi:hypothetical protein
MFLTNHQKRSALALLSPVLIIFVTSAVEVCGQGGRSSGASMRDQARAIQREELDRMLIASLPKTEANSNRAEVMKQVRADFKDLQELNNKMMATAWEREALDYSFLSDMVSRIKEKANRLKTNLNLPALSENEKAATAKTISNTGEYRAALLVLDETIMRFVNNPLFRTPNTIEIDLATKARRDLEAVIFLASDLKKTASRLSKTSPSHQ